MDVIKKKKRSIPVQCCTTTGYAQMQTSFVAREQKIVSLLQQHIAMACFVNNVPQLIISAPRQAQISC